MKQSQFAFISLNFVRDIRMIDGQAYLVSQYLSPMADDVP